MDTADKWIAAKAKEDAAKKERLEIEQQIMSEGPEKFKDRLVVQQGIKREWDQDKLAEIADDLPAGLFKTQYKENVRNVKAIEEMSPEFYRDKLEPLLTETPKKPSFKKKES